VRNYGCRPSDYSNNGYHISKVRVSASPTCHPQDMFIAGSILPGCDHPLLPLGVQPCFLSSTLTSAFHEKGRVPAEHKATWRTALADEYGSAVTMSAVQGSIAGTVIVIIVVIALCCLATFFLARMRSRRRAQVCPALFLVLRITEILHRMSQVGIVLFACCLLLHREFQMLAYRWPRGQRPARNADACSCTFHQMIIVEGAGKVCAVP